MGYFQLPVYMCGGSGKRWGIINAEEFDEIAKLLRAYTRMHAGAACFDGLAPWTELELFCICSSYGEHNQWHHRVMATADNQPNQVTKANPFIGVWARAMMGAAVFCTKTLLN